MIATHIHWFGTSWPDVHTCLHFRSHLWNHLYWFLFSRELPAPPDSQGFVSITCWFLAPRTMSNLPPPRHLGITHWRKNSNWVISGSCDSCFTVSECHLCSGKLLTPYTQGQKPASVVCIATSVVQREGVDDAQETGTQFSWLHLLPQHSLTPEASFFTHPSLTLSLTSLKENQKHCLVSIHKAWAHFRVPARQSIQDQKENGRRHR